jgi:hypothetical protein
MPTVTIDDRTLAALAAFSNWWKAQGGRLSGRHAALWSEQPGVKLTCDDLAPLAEFAAGVDAEGEFEMPEEAAAVADRLVAYLKWEVAPGATNNGDFVLLGSPGLAREALVGVEDVRALARLSDEAARTHVCARRM